MAETSGGFWLRKDGPGSEDEREAEPDPQASIGERRPPSNGFEQANLDCAAGKLLRGLMLGEEDFKRRSFGGVAMLVCSVVGGGVGRR